VYVTGLRWKRFIPATTGGSGADIVVVTERWGRKGDSLTGEIFPRLQNSENWTFFSFALGTSVF
jgi:hypothetical protein